MKDNIKITVENIHEGQVYESVSIASVHLNDDVPMTTGRVAAAVLKRFLENSFDIRTALVAIVSELADLDEDLQGLRDLARNLNS